MKYIKRTTKDIKNNYLMELLKDRGILKDDEEFNKNFFKPGISNELSSEKLDNMDKAYEIFLKHLQNNSKIYICVDSDVDGFTSAALLINFIKDNYNFEFNYEYHIPEGKEHGLKTLMDIFTDSKKYDLIILPDSSSNDYEEHKILKDMGYDILVLDHHEAEKYSENAIVINNQLSSNYENKCLSGVGVVYKFLEYFSFRYWKEFEEKGIEEEFFEPIFLNYLDLVALGQISDMMQFNTLENRWICEEGLSHINNKFFKTLIEQQSYSLGSEITQIGVAFYITPLINALIRVGNKNDKENLFKAFIEPELIVPSTKRGEKGLTETICTQSVRNCVNAKSRQNREKDKAMELLSIQIIENCLDENKVLILNADDLDTPNTLTGLCAMGVSAAYKKPVMLGRISPDGYLKGSIRGRGESELKDFRGLLLSSGLMDYVEGHSNAAGFSIHESNIEKLTNFMNTKLKDVNFNEGFYEVDFIANKDEDIRDLIFDLNKGKALWGQGNEEAMILIENIEINDYSVIGSNKDTLKFTYNGVTYIKFKCKNLINTFNGQSLPMTVNVVGKAAVNEYKGFITPQILIEDIEIKNCVEIKEDEDIWLNF